jgi:hypothetical protein
MVRTFLILEKVMFLWRFLDRKARKSFRGSAVFFLRTAASFPLIYIRHAGFASGGLCSFYNESQLPDIPSIREEDGNIRQSSGTGLGLPVIRYFLSM